MSHQRPPQSEEPQNGMDFSRLIREQLFWGMLGPLIPNVILMVAIYNIPVAGLGLLAVIGLYWLGISALIAFVVTERGKHNDVQGSNGLAIAGALLGTLGVVIVTHLLWSIFATFQEVPANAFAFVLLINLLGTLSALVGFHSERIKSRLNS